jgi:hypothetical protein
MVLLLSFVVCGFITIAECEFFCLGTKVLKHSAGFIGGTLF